MSTTNELTFNKDIIDIVVYHGPFCPDGFGSAFVVWGYYKRTENEREIDFHATSYFVD